MKKTTLFLATALLMILPAAAPAARIFVGGAFIGGPAFYGPGFYAPAPYGFYPYDNRGTVKIDTKQTDALVFVNGAYAGTVKDNKTMHFRPGNYNIEIRHAGVVTFSESVAVISGKTLHITPAA